jgi:hypothetical protein
VLIQERPEKAAGQYPAAYRAQNCVLSKWPRPPRLRETCIGKRRGRIKTAVPSKEQTNCCGADTIHPVSTSAFPNACLTEEREIDAYLSVHPDEER